MVNIQLLVNYLKRILGTEDVANDIVSYISSIKHEEDFEEFMENIVNKNDRDHMAAYKGIKSLIFNKPIKISGHVNGNEGPAQSFSKPKESINQPLYAQVKKKGKAKFHDINSYEVKKKEKEGRKACDCLGQEHEFMNNCLACGRIHCMEEGPGPCLFCKNPVNQRGVMNNDDSKLKAALKHKKNKVFDDDKDYFKTNAKKSADEDKKRMVIALDFASRKVIEGSKEDARIRENLLQESIKHLEKVETIYKNIQKESEGISSLTKMKNNMNEDLINLLIQMRHRKPEGEEDLGPEDKTMPIINYGREIIDEELLLHTDHGVCLSMHQPHASLLVAGVKKHEGRTWPTTHRGRLWIAAAAKRPEDDEIVSVENFYREYYKDPSLQFPMEYPTSCLLGCVFVKDCLSQAEYEKKYPNGESNSPYVLICSDPIILPIFYPIAGKHKIYPLEKELHRCAKLALQHATYV